MADSGDIGRELQHLREAHRISQAELAAAAGVSIHSLRSYEAGRRRPSKPTLHRLASALYLSERDTGHLLALLGDSVDSSPLIAALREVRGEPAMWVTELAACEWVTLVMNERHQVLGWNGLASAVAEMDFARELPTQSERNLLWMASLPHFEARLTNWEELIGRFVAIMRAESGGELDHPGALPPYLQALTERLEKERPFALMRFFKLWAEAPEWQDGVRNLHRVEWRLADGTELRFVAVHRDLSLYDGIFAFDWHPADAGTGEWTDRMLARVGRRAWLPGVRELERNELPTLLRAVREEMGLSRREVAERAGISADALFKCERGLRTPRRDTVVSIANALGLDGWEANSLLRGWGYDSEPSDFARVLAGYQAKGIFAGRQQFRSRALPRVQSELRQTPWPSFLLNGRCQVIGANSKAAALTGYRQYGTGDDGEAPHLLQLVLNNGFRSHLRNWIEVATAVVPDALRPMVLGRAPTKGPGDFERLVHSLRREHTVALRELLAAWEATPPRPAPRRIWTPIEWIDESGELLRFHCMLNPWNAYDPYWAVDWHPANRAAWRFVNE